MGKEGVGERWRGNYEGKEELRWKERRDGAREGGERIC